MTNSPSIVNDLIIPASGIPYILLQRTGYQTISRSLPVRAAGKLFAKESVLNFAIQLESKVRRQDIVELFNKDILSEYNSIKAWLPPRAAAILDVGCGVGGIDAYLYRHYQSFQPELYLLDKSEVSDRVFYSFHDRGAFYNSLPLTGEFLTANGVPQEQIHLLEATSDNQIRIAEKLDLVISLISWGYHYPVRVYLDQVYELLQDGGHLIIDIRKNAEQEKDLQAKFSTVTVIAEQANHLRVLAVKHA